MTADRNPVLPPSARWAAGAAVGGLAIVAALLAAGIGGLSAGLAVAVVAVLVAGALAVFDGAARRSSLRAETAERDRERLNRLLRDQAGLVLEVDREGRVVGAYGEPPWGVPAVALFGEGLGAACVTAERSALLAAMAEAHEQGEAALNFTPAEAPHRTVSALLRRTGDGRLAVSLHDDTALADRVRAAERDRDRARLESTAKSKFLASMSHELRTPLNAVLGYADVMRLRLFGVLPERYADYPERIHEAGRHLLDLINDVLDVSKIEADKYQLTLEAFDAREPVRAALAILRVQADEAGVSLRTDLPAVAVTVEADRRALKQMVFNLVGNALKFTPRGGLTRLLLAATADGALELTVADTGVGIAAEDMQRLGQPYEQAGDADARARGTGLGLALVKALAGLHGGTLSIESAPGEGAAFTVRLPVLRPLGFEVRTRPDNVVAFAAQR